MTEAPAITFGGVDRSFGPVKAISDFSFEVPTGSVTVLVGPNGAGKTTTIRLTTGALAADSGRVRVFGADPMTSGTMIRQRCGVVPPKPALYERLTGRENLNFAGRLYAVSDAGRIDQEAERFGIVHALHASVSGYSTGMRTRLALARAMLHDPELLLLDEPTAGLDPESARDVLRLILETASSGRTVVVCTHLLHEAEGIADQVVVMDHGAAWAIGSPKDLARRFWDGAVVRFEAEDVDSLGMLANLPGVEEVHQDGLVRAQLAHLDQLPDIVARLVEAGVRLTRVEPENPTLERLYFAMRERTGGR